MTTAYQSYQKPIDDLSAHYEREENVWDGCLTDKEIAAGGLAREFNRQGSEIAYSEMSEDDHYRALGLLEEHRQYPIAVRLFLGLPWPIPCSPARPCGFCHQCGRKLTPKGWCDNCRMRRIDDETH